MGGAYLSFKVGKHTRCVWEEKGGGGSGPVHQSLFCCYTAHALSPHHVPDGHVISPALAFAPNARPPCRPLDRGGSQGSTSLAAV